MLIVSSKSCQGSCADYQYNAAGTVLAVELKTSGVAGYSATEAAKITKALRQKHIFARPLGNVVYLMVTPTTAKDTCTSLLERLLTTL